MPDYQYGGVDPHTLMPKTYSAGVLRTIRAASQHDHRLKILPFGTIKRIKELKLNNKRRKQRNKEKNQAAIQAIWL